jgi:hypothetical protein
MSVITIPQPGQLFDDAGVLLDAGSAFDRTLAVAGNIHTNDGIHPNVRGHAFYASKMMQQVNAAGIFGSTSVSGMKRRTQ